MTINLLTVVVKHERRVRLVFTNTLDTGALDPSLYDFTNEDGKGPSPDVLEVYDVPSATDTVELALSQPLVEGGLYTVSAVGVPATDTSTTPDPSSQEFRFGLTTTAVNVEPIRNNRDALLYGVDLVWNDIDYQETSSGDLDTVSGTPNVGKALLRAAASDGLPWDDTYGAHAREFVDSPSAASGTLRGNVISAVLRDPRIKSASSTIVVDNASTYLSVSPVLKTGVAMDPVSVTIPND